MNTRPGPPIPWRRGQAGAKAAGAFVLIATFGLAAGPAEASTQPMPPRAAVTASKAAPPGPHFQAARATAPANARVKSGQRGTVPRIPVGADPQTAVLDSVTRTLYVDNSSDNTVSVIDAGSCNAKNTVGCGRPAPTVTVSDGAGALAFDPATRTLYVTGSNVISMIDASTCNARHLSGCGQTPLTAPVGQLPLSVAVNHTTGTVYVANAADNDLSVISVATCNAHTTVGCAHQRILHLGNFPGIGAIDEGTDTVYVDNNGANQQGQNDTVSVVNGATCNAHVGSGCGQTPPQIPIGFGNINDSVGVVLVKATRTLYITNGGDNTLSVINTAACNAVETADCSKTPPTVSVGSNPQGVGVDPVFRTLYVANSNDDTLSVINGSACNATETAGCADRPGGVRTGQSPIFVAGDTATHTMYVVDIDGRDVSVVNAATCNPTNTIGCTRFPPTVTSGAGPGLMAVNAKTDTLYVTNYLDNTVSVINTAACNDTATWGCGQNAPVVPVGAGPGDIALNLATDTAYVTNSNDNTISVIDGATCQAEDSTGCAHTPPVIADHHDPLAVVVDQATDTVYVSNADGTVSVINGTNCRAGVTNGCNRTPPTIQASVHALNDITFNPLTRTIYATTLHDGTVSVINGTTCNATVSTGCGQTPPTITVGPRPLGVRVDQRTNTVYVANIFTNTGYGNTVSVFNGATCDAAVTSGCGQSPITVTVGLGPNYMAIDQATDAVYVVNGGDYSVSVINGTSCNASDTIGCNSPFPTVQVGGGADGIDVSSTTHTVYVANFNDNNVSVFGSR